MAMASTVTNAARNWISRSRDRPLMFRRRIKKIMQIQSTMTRLTLALLVLLFLFALTTAVNAQPVPSGIPSVQSQNSWSTSVQPSKGTKDIIAIILVIAGFVGAFISQIYFIVRAFRVSAVWGVFMLLFPGLTTLFFCLFEFEQARRPLGILLFSIGMIVGAFFLMR